MSEDPHKNCNHKPMVHLHVHSDMSLLDGCGKIEDYIKIAKKTNQPALALTEHGNASSSLQNYLKCKAAGLKSIMGAELYLNDEISKHEERKDEGKNTHQLVLVKDIDGFRNLNHLTYLSFQPESYYYKGRINSDMLFENKKGLICTSTCLASQFNRLIEQNKPAEAEERIKTFMREFGDDFYIELQFNEIPQQKDYNHFLLRMIKKYSLPFILTSDVHYCFPEDNKLQDLLLSINQKTDINDPSAFKLNARHLNFSNRDDFHWANKEFGFNYPEKFVDECLDNTVKLAEKCNFEFETGVEKYPKFQPEQDVIDYFKTSDTKEIITKLSHAKLNQKLNLYKKNGLVKINDEVIKQYRDRLDYELKVIDDKKMLDYFMVLWELLQFCKKNSISIGTGRGSVCGSLLAWCIDITKVDSIRHELYFERFLNPQRKSTCDIDTDYESGSDDLTLQFLYSKYGKERVIPVVTFSRFNEKACLKDVIRAMGGETGFGSDAQKITSEMPQKPTWDISLKEWFETWHQNPDCSEEVKSWLLDPKNDEIRKYTLKLQGQVRNIGKHAAGITILPDAVWNYMPVNISKGQIVSGFQESGSGKDLSELGILKLDRLNLGTLNVIKNAIKLVKEHKGIDIQEQVDEVDLTDQNLFFELRMGNNQGIFQMDSSGMNALIQGIKIDRFSEIVCCTSLFRPGPMGVRSHLTFISNKFYPEKREYIHPSLEPLLEETNGVLVYQEQLMFILNKLGGLDYGVGDNIRKYMDAAGPIISKKLNGILLNEKEENDENYKNYNELWKLFIDGAKKNGLSEKEVGDIEGWLNKYLGYSFNKCLSKNHTVHSKTRGKINILDVEIGEEILCYNPINKQNEYCPVKNIHKNGIKEIYQVHILLTKLECTLDHKIMTENGLYTLSEIIEKEYKMKVGNGFYDTDEIYCLGNTETFDLEIDSKFHNYYANGVCVSNSHALAYSIITMQTLFLKHYYPAEFYTALLNFPKSIQDKDKEKQWMQAVLMGCLSKGIEIIPPVRKSNLEWSLIDNKTIAMGLQFIDGFGDIAFQEYQTKNVANMTKDQFFSTRFSKFNKKSFESCVKAGLFDDWSESREEILEWKKQKNLDVMQIDMFGEVGVQKTTKYRKMPKTPDIQKYKEFMEVCNLDLQLLKRLHELKENFKKEYDMDIESVTNFEDPKKYYYFCLEKIEPKLTKTGKTMYIIHLSDGAQVKKVNMWDNMYKKLAKEMEIGSVYITKFMKNKGWLSFDASGEFRKMF